MIPRDEAERFVRENVQVGLNDENYLMWYLYNQNTEPKGCGGCIALQEVTEKTIEELFDKMVDYEMNREGA